MPASPPLKIKIQLYCGEEIAMGPGKADLLDAIEQQGSISGASRSMGMSYRRAWLLVDAMNRCWREPLVATVVGAGRDSGAHVTPFGKTVLAHYRSLQSRLGDAAMCDDREALDLAILPAPLGSG